MELFRSSPVRLLLVLAALCLPSAGWAQDAGDDDGGVDSGYTPPYVLPDASVPDASVGEGGADRDNPESQDSADRIPTTCRQSIECERGFQCQAGRCIYTGIRHAEGGGCLGAVPALIAAVGLVAVRKRRRE